MLDFKKVNPNENETYWVCEDDGELVITSGKKGELTKDSQKVWISKAMAKWISDYFNK